MKFNKGFTLVELMVTIAVAGVLVSFAVPSFSEKIAQQRLKSHASDLISNLNAQRSKAVNIGKISDAVVIKDKPNLGIDFTGSDDVYLAYNRDGVAGTISSVEKKDENGDVIKDDQDNPVFEDVFTPLTNDVTYQFTKNSKRMSISVPSYGQAKVIE